MNADPLPATVPMPAWRRSAAVPSGIADRPSAAGWRDDALLVAAVTGAITINLVPAAWVVVGRPSGAFLMFALMVPVSWAITAALQIAVLRWLRAGRRPGPRLAALQFAAAAAIGVAYSLLCSTALNPYSEQLGLDGGDAWGAGVYAAWTSVLVAAFLVWHREGRHRQAEASQRLRSVQLAQLAARRSLVESQLQAVQARIDPQHFFDTLDAIETLYRRDVRLAEALFDELIVFLRAALPNLQSASSVLARELDLAAACVRMQALASGDDVALEIDVDRSLQRQAFPPGLLLPLLRGVVQAGAGGRRIGLSVRAGAGGASPAALVVSITAGAAPDDITLRRARETLRSLFGTRASISVDPSRDRRVTTRLWIDHERL